MSKIGANDPCICGSGLKYKKCCRDGIRPTWYQNADIILENNPFSKEIKTVFFTLLECIDKKHWMGACHATSAIMYVIFRELGLSPQLFLGEVKHEESIFDHSWIELDGEIIDVAILLSMQNDMIYPPILLGKSISTLHIPTANYQYQTGRGLDAEADTISRTNIATYINMYPNSKNGLWELILQISETVNLHLDITAMQQKYSNIYWQIKMGD